MITQKKKLFNFLIKLYPNSTDNKLHRAFGVKETSPEPPYIHTSTDEQLQVSTCSNFQVLKGRVIFHLLLLLFLSDYEY